MKRTFGAATTIPMTPTGIEGHVGVRFDFREVEGFTPAQLDALFGGIAEVLAASGRDDAGPPQPLTFDSFV